MPMRPTPRSAACRASPPRGWALARQDRRQYLARLLAVVGFGAIGLLMWASSHPGGGLWLLALAAAFVPGFLGVLLWMARHATRLEPARDVAPLGVARLGERLASLAVPGGAYAIAGGASAAEWIVDLRVGAGSGRLHRVRLAADERRGEVRVRELLQAAGAAPRDVAERSLRAPGEPAFDPARPDAAAVWTRTAQATLLEPAQVAGFLLACDRDDRIRVPEAVGPGCEPDTAVALLAAVVLASGYAWQPMLPGGKGM